MEINDLPIDPETKHRYFDCYQDMRIYFLSEFDGKHIKEIIVRSEKTDILLLPKDIRVNLLKIRDALIAENKDEAYHILYSMVDPGFAEKDPWKKLEKSVKK